MTVMAKSIREAREALGLSRRQLAKKLNKFTLTIISWEVGKTIPKPICMLDVSRSLSISIEKMMYGVEENELPKDRESLAEMGNRIMMHRLDKGISKDKMAALLSKDTTFIDDIEKGNIAPDAVHMYYIGKYLNVSPSYLRYGVE